MADRHRLTDAELAEIRRRRAGVRASLACEGMVLTAEEEALFDAMERERLTPDERAAAHHAVEPRKAPPESACLGLMDHPYCAAGRKGISFDHDQAVGKSLRNRARVCRLNYRTILPACSCNWRGKISPCFN